MASRVSPRIALIALGAALVVSFAIYWPIFRGGYFADDYFFYFKGLTSDPLYFFTHVSPVNPVRYRPVDSGFMVAIQNRWDLNPVPVYSIGIVVHALLGWFVFLFAFRLGRSLRAGAIAGAALLVSQASATNVAGTDMLSQNLSVLFGACGLWAYSVSCGWSGKAAAFVMSALALLCKETGIAFSLALLGILAYRWRARKIGTSEMVVSLGCALIWIGAYGVLHGSVVAPQPLFGHNASQLAIGRNIPAHALVILADVPLPFSSIAVVDCFFRGAWPWLAGLAIVAGAWSLLQLAGLVIDGHRRDKRALLALIAIMSLPMLFTAHIREEYLYSLSPLYAVLLSLVCLSLLERGGVAKKLATGFLIVFLVGSSLGARQKVDILAENGRRSAGYLHELAGFARAVPRGGTIELVDLGEPREFSVYRVRPLALLPIDPRQLASLVHRPDLTIRRLKEAQLATSHGALLRLCVRGGRLVEY